MTTISPDEAATWVADYGRAWVERDPDLAVALFTDDALYHQTPFGPHYQGHAEIALYWADITAAESDVSYRAGTPVVAGDTVACEWWVTMSEHGEWTTLPGVLAPFDGWGRST